LLENLALKFQKVPIRPKNISLAKFKYNYSKVAEFYADLTVEKNEKKLQKKLQVKKCRNLEFALFSITNLLKFSANNFFKLHLFPIISTDLKSA
jgi:hypothetical protein